MLHAVRDWSGFGPGADEVHCAQPAGRVYPDARAAAQLQQFDRPHPPPEFCAQNHRLGPAGGENPFCHAAPVCGASDWRFCVRQPLPLRLRADRADHLPPERRPDCPAAGERNLWPGEHPGGYRAQGGL